MTPINNLDCATQHSGGAVVAQSGCAVAQTTAPPGVPLKGYLTGSGAVKVSAGRPDPARSEPAQSIMATLADCAWHPRTQLVEHIATATGMKIKTVQNRISELKTQGDIRQWGKRIRITQSGQR